jgi:uncharacterized protein (UPF0332 family)
VLDELLLTNVKLRLEKAENCLKIAELLLAEEAYADAANRSYYCIFHAMNAVLITEGFSAKTHSGCISEFSKRYIKTGVFSKDLSEIIRTAFTVRNKSDYDVFYVVVKSEVVKQIENAKIFLSAVEKYINTLDFKKAN